MGIKGPRVRGTRPAYVKRVPVTERPPAPLSSPFVVLVPHFHTHRPLTASMAPPSPSFGSFVNPPKPTGGTARQAKHARYNSIKPSRTRTPVSLPPFSIPHSSSGGASLLPPATQPDVKFVLLAGGPVSRAPTGYGELRRTSSSESSAISVALAAEVPRLLTATNTGNVPSPLPYQFFFDSKFRRKTTDMTSVKKKAEVLESEHGGAPVPDVQLVPAAGITSR